MLKEIIDKFYLDRQKDREQQHFYITDAGRCPRSIFFKFKNAPRKEMEARILRMFEHGDHIHQLIMKSLITTRDIHVIASEIKIPPQELISGRADAVISDGKDLFILDIKSMNSMIFRNLESAKEENIDQLQLYLHFFKIPKGILLYVNKDSQELKEFIINYDKKRAKALLDVLTKLQVKINSNIIPDKISTWPKDWQCKYCQFKGVCSKTGKGELNWDDFKEKVEKVSK